MIRVRTVALAALMAMLVTSTSNAEPFEGPHAEVFGGWNHDRNPLIRAGKDKHRDDLIYGASAGYDLRFGQVVAGISGEVGDSTAHNCRTITATDFSQSACSHAGVTLFGGGRIGYVASPSTLLYVTGGYASARTSGSFTEKRGDQTVEGKAHYTSDGYRVGAGAELQLTDSIFTRLEYRYQRLDADNRALSHQHQVATAVGLRF